jgi:hypothetical protein
MVWICFKDEWKKGLNMKLKVFFLSWLFNGIKSDRVINISIVVWFLFIDKYL